MAKKPSDQSTTLTLQQGLYLWLSVTMTLRGFLGDNIKPFPDQGKAKAALFTALTDPNNKALIRGIVQKPQTDRIADLMTTNWPAYTSIHSDLLDIGSGATKLFTTGPAPWTSGFQVNAMSHPTFDELNSAFGVSAPLNGKNLAKKKPVAKKQVVE